MTIFSKLVSVLILGACLNGPLGANTTDQTEQSTSSTLELLEAARGDISAFKHEMIRQELQLSPEEANTFWPLYQEYEAALATHAQLRLKNITKYLELSQSTTDDDAWDQLAKAFLRQEQLQLALWQEYQGKFSIALTPFRAAQFLQVESRLALLVELAIITELPSITVSALEAAEEIPVHIRQYKTEMIATVEMVDPETREITLRGDQGKRTTIIAGEEIERFDEIQTGDHVRAVYLIGMAAELREPTAEEIEQPLVIMEDSTDADSSAAPATVGARVIKAVCTIEGLSRQTRSVTVKGPLGNYMDIDVEEVANLSELTIGQSVILTYTEALAVELKKLVLEPTAPESTPTL